LRRNSLVSELTKVVRSTAAARPSPGSLALTARQRDRIRLDAAGAIALGFRLGIWNPGTHLAIRTVREEAVNTPPQGIEGFALLRREGSGIAELAGEQAPASAKQVAERRHDQPEPRGRSRPGHLRSRELTLGPLFNREWEDIGRLP
jgi:hypothetical protein